MDTNRRILAPLAGLDWQFREETNHRSDSPGRHVIRAYVLWSMALHPSSDQFFR